MQNRRAVHTIAQNKVLRYKQLLYRDVLIAGHVGGLGDE